MQGQTDRHTIRIEDSQIESGHFAIIESQSSGDDLFFGHVAGDASLVIHSSGRLWSQYFADANRLLVAEYTAPTGLGYRLLEISIDGTEVGCRQLVESRLAILSPVVPDGPGSESILFMSGEYDPEAKGIPVNNHRVTRLRDGKVAVLSGDSFLTIGRLTQISEARFLAVSTMIWKWAENGAPSSYDKAENRIVEISIEGDTVKADYSDLFGAPGHTPAGISLFPEADIAFEIFYNFPKGGRQDYIARYDTSGGKPLETIALPRDRDFSAPFAEVAEDGQIVIRLLSVSRKTEGRDGVVLVSELSGTRLVNERRIKLDAPVRFDTENCTAAEVRF